MLNLFTNLIILMIYIDLGNASHIRAAAFGTNPYIEVYPDGRIGGVDIRVMTLLSKALNFKFDVSLSTHWGYMNAETETWGGMVGQLVNGTRGVALGQVTFQYPMSRFIDYTTPIYNIQYMYVPTKPKPIKTLGNVLYPLSYSVWIMIVVSIISIIIASWILVKFKYFHSILWTMTSIAMAQSGSTKITCATSRGLLLQSTWILSCFVLMCAYKCNLLSSMLVILYEKPLLTFEDLLERGEPIYMPIAPLTATLKTSPFKIERDLYQMALETNSFYYFKANKAFEQLHKMAKTGKGSLMMSEGTYDAGIEWAIKTYNGMPFMKPKQK